jgi:1A family penicillin-binding protein
VERRPNHFEKQPAFHLPPPTAEELGILPASSLGVWFKVLRTLSLVVFVSALIGVGSTWTWLHALGVFDFDPDVFVKQMSQQTQDNTVVYDRSGAKIGEFFDRYQIYLPYEKLPPMLVKSILAIEDRSYFHHRGIDVKAIIRAAYQSVVEGGYTQGASTITQQLVRNVFLSREKSIARKVKEIVLAVRIDQHMSKERIFELYANTLFLGFGSYGVGAAAQRFFGKNIDQLEGFELALLAGLFQSPSNYNPHRYPDRAKHRQRQVIQALYQSQFLTREEALSWMEKPLVYTDYQPINEQHAPFFLDFIRDQADKVISKKIENSGLRIYTTLDSRLQKTMNESMTANAVMLDDLQKKIRPDYRRHRRGDTPILEAAMLSVDPRTGEVLAMVGGRDYQRSKYNRTWQALRSPGSSFKPVVYTAALERGRQWFDVELVGPVSIDGYRPKNYKEEFLTETTLLRAFYLSLNTAAVSLAAEVGLDTLLTTASRLGVRSELKLEAGTALGSSSVTMFDLARMYATFANKGIQTDTVAIQKITDKNGKILYEAAPLAQRQHVAVNPQVAYLMIEGLRSVMTRGTAQSAADLSAYAVGKTGTSNDSVDNWFCGTTPEVTTVAWVGNDLQLSIDGNMTGGMAALPLWSHYHRQILANQPGSKGFVRPVGLSSAFIHPKYGNRSGDGLRMYFTSKSRPANAHSDYQSMEEKGIARSLFSH